MASELFVKNIEEINTEVNDFLTNQYNPMLEELNEKLRSMVERYDIRKEPLVTMTEDEIIDTILNQVPANKNGDFKKPFDPQEYIDITDKKIKNLINFMDDAIDKSEDFPNTPPSYHMIKNMNEYATKFYLFLKTEEFLVNCKKYNVEVDLGPSSAMFELMVEFNRLLIKYLTYSIDVTSAHLFHKSTITKKINVNDKDANRIHAITLGRNTNQKPAYLEILRGEIRNFLSFNKPKEAEEMYEMIFYKIHSIEGPYYANFKDLYKQRKGLINAYNQLQISLRHSHLLLNVSIPRKVGSGEKVNTIPLMVINECGIFVFQTIESKMLKITEDKRRNRGDIIINDNGIIKNAKPSEDLTARSILSFARDNARNIAYFLNDKLGYTGDKHDLNSLLKHNLERIHYGVIFMKGDIYINTNEPIFNIGSHNLHQYIENDTTVLNNDEVANFYQLFKPFANKSAQHIVFGNIKTCINDFQNYSKDLFTLIDSYGHIQQKATSYFINTVENIYNTYMVQRKSFEKEQMNRKAIIMNNKNVDIQKRKEFVFIDKSFKNKYMLLPYPIVLFICSFVFSIISLFGIDAFGLCAIGFSINALIVTFVIMPIRNDKEYQQTHIEFDDSINLAIKYMCIAAPIISIASSVISGTEFSVFPLIISIAVSLTIFKARLYLIKKVIG